DIGGFFRPGRVQYTDEKYHELLTRWFQWGAFNPIFRMHGYQSETEPWKFGEKTESNMRKMLHLRYRLLPYIYSEAWQVTHKGSTMMRPLVMDFGGDTASVKQPYEYMFGKAFLVAPVTEAGATQRDVRLPEFPLWYDFWTGSVFRGGQTIRANAPLDKIPLFVKAGSIVPMGPIVQYAGEKEKEPLEIRIYEGANGEFTLYEDEGDNFNYEKGIYTTISFIWDDENKTLTIDDRKGSFPGMQAERKFNIRLASRNKKARVDTTGGFDKVIDYRGRKVITVFP
ncbi:MAG: glycoside hydrolase family 31 protein, partial [Prolixibacteraceae bacterium]|nr:glycoside hydrolase family 31 protein [Prolixibacteraceae bacterium]